MRRNRIWPEIGLLLPVLLFGLLPLTARSFQVSKPHRRHHRRVSSPVVDTHSATSPDPVAETPLLTPLARPTRSVGADEEGQALQTSGGTPPAVVGPPTLDELAAQSGTDPTVSPECLVNREKARQLLAACRSGCLVLTVPTREEAQLRALAQEGLYRWPSPPSHVTVRTARQREILANTAPEERAIGYPLPSRSNAPNQRGVMGNPGDAADFDPLRKPPSSLLLRMLSELAAHSTPERPLELMSLLRPLYRVGGFVHVGPSNPHSLGLAADIAAYGGHRVRQDEPEECVAATLALLRDLPPGRYRLGLPKAPEFPLKVGRPPLPPSLLAWLAASPGSEEGGRSKLADPAVAPSPFGSENTTPDPAVHRTVLSDRVAPSRVFLSPLRRVPQPAGSVEGATSPAAPAETPILEESDPAMKPACITAAAIGATLDQWGAPWPFFPAPEPVVEEGLVAPLRVNGRVVRDGAGHPVPGIARFRNEEYADAGDLGDPRLQRALEAASRRGVEIVALFPDGADHVHIDVRQVK